MSLNQRSLKSKAWLQILGRISLQNVEISERKKSMLLFALLTMVYSYSCYVTTVAMRTNCPVSGKILKKAGSKYSNEVLKYVDEHGSPEVGAVSLFEPGDLKN